MGLPYNRFDFPVLHARIVRSCRPEERRGFVSLSADSVLSPEIHPEGITLTMFQMEEQAPTAIPGQK